VLVTAVLTGFGLFGDAPSRFREAPQLIALPLAFAVAGVIFALVVLIPTIGGADFDDLDNLEGRFRRRIRFRSVFVGLAMGSLLASLAFGALSAVTVFSRSGPSEPAITFARGAGADGPTLTATVTDTRAPSGATAEFWIRDLGTGALVYHAVQLVGSAGDIKIEAQLPKAATSASLSALFTLTSDHELIRKQISLGP
jgi:hypothetical protein